MEGEVNSCQSRSLSECEGIISTSGRTYNSKRTTLDREKKAVDEMAAENKAAGLQDWKDYQFKKSTGKNKTKIQQPWKWQL